MNPSPRKGPWTRNTIACTNCRKRRTRCLGNPCAFCSKYGLQCVFQPLSVKQQQQTAPRASPHDANNAQQSFRSSQSSDAPTPFTFAGPRQDLNALPACPLSPPAATISGDGAVADAMGQVGSLAAQYDNGALSEYYGTSSALSFVQAIIAAAPNGQPGSVQTWHSSPSTADHVAVGLAGFPSDDKDPRVLPLRTLADHLLQIYFDKSHDVLRILHKPTLLQEYFNVWQPGNRTSYKFLALLNIIFALALLFNAGGPSKESEQHCNRASRCYEIGAIQEPMQLRDVQVELLKCHYLQGSSSAARCWRSLSKAISSAYAVGVNRAPNHSADPVVRQLQLRAWLACRNLDAVISGTLGRLPNITHSTSEMVPEPAEIEDEDIALYERVPTHSNVPCRISVFLWSARIYSVVSHALQTLYAPIDTTGIETDEYEEAKAMMDLERDLLNLRETLPEHLSISDPIDLSAPTWSVRHRIILRNRYFRARLLVLRPALLRGLKRKVQNLAEPNADEGDTGSQALATTQRTFAQQASLATASEQIEFCFATMDRQYDAPWYRRFYMCDCMSTLLACRVLGIGLQDFEIYWDKASRVFHGTLPKEGSDALSRGLALLTSIKSHLAQPSQSQLDFTTDISALLANCDVYLGTQGSDWIDAYLNFDQLEGDESASHIQTPVSAAFDFLNYTSNTS